MVGNEETETMPAHVKRLLIVGVASGCAVALMWAVLRPSFALQEGVFSFFAWGISLYLLSGILWRKKEHAPVKEGVAKSARLRAVRIACDILLVAAMLGGLVILHASSLSDDSTGPRKTRVLSAKAEGIMIMLAVMALVVMPIWMASGGAHSPLWYCVPPFMPWGFIAKTREARWFLVILLEIATGIGLVGTATDWLDRIPGFK